MQVWWQSSRDSIPKAPDDSESDSREREIGSQLQTLTTTVVGCGAKIDQFLADAGKNPHRTDILEPLAALIADLKIACCRIAIVGQVKAGKSSLANALIRLAGFLPTDINPWTAVVTQIHLGDPSGGTSGCEFQFFSDAEWRELVESGGRLKELTERLVPGYNSSELHEKVAALRARAERKLGADFKRLLGQTHRFDNAGADILRQYVCSEPEPGDMGSPDIGKYSEITRVARVFLPKGQFAFPSVVIDTPGTNDPLLVSDEVTRQCLEGADINIVVISALQALAIQDLALLRLIQGLHKTRVIIFVNRIDQLQDAARDGELVVAAIEDFISREYPSARIRVLAGSAMWGEYALDLGSAPAEGIFSRQLMARAEQIGAARAEDFARWRVRPQAASAEIARVLSACSGIPALRGAISELMLHGPQAFVLRQAIGVMHTLTAYTESAMAARAELTTKGGESAAGQTSSTDLAAIRAKVSLLRGLARGIDPLARAVNDKLEAARELATVELGDRFNEAVDAFADTQANELCQVAARAAPEKTWRCDSYPLRRNLEQLLVDAHRANQARVREIQEWAITELRSIAMEAGVRSDILVGREFLAFADRSSRPGALGKMVAMDLGQAWWNEWWKTSDSAGQKAAKLRDLIKTEFRPIGEDLLDAVNADFEHCISTTMEQFLLLYADAFEALADDYAALE